MSFKVTILKKIKAREMELAFRKWTRPTIKEEGTLITSVGQLRIINIKEIDAGNFSFMDTRRAGIENKAELLRHCNTRRDRPLRLVVLNIPYVSSRDA